jgi:hypothetical protein
MTCPLFLAGVWPLCQLDALRPAVYAKIAECLDMVSKCDKPTLRDAELAARRKQKGARP